MRVGHDQSYAFNARSFLELLPPPGRLTVDLGCGEGRLTSRLHELAHAVVGVDSSPAMVRLARERNPGPRYVEADAVALPLGDGVADLVVAFMSLMSMDDLDRAIAETARVLGRGGRFCIAVLHPIAAAASRVDDDGTVVIEGSYLETGPWIKTIERDGGARFTFNDVRRPLSGYAGALERGGLELEALREPVPRDGEINRAAVWQRVPLFLHLRAVKP